MASKSSDAWYFWNGDQKTGPFRLRELQAKLEKGEIQETSLVSRQDNEDKKITVLEMLKSRPDPADSLFDALEAAKKKREHQSQSLAQFHTQSAASYSHSRFRLNIRMVILGLLFLSGIVWLFVQLIHRILSQPSLPTPSPTFGKPHSPRIGLIQKPTDAGIKRPTHSRGISQDTQNAATPIGHPEPSVDQANPQEPDSVAQPESEYPADYPEERNREVNENPYPSEDPNPPYHQ